MYKNFSDRKIYVKAESEVLVYEFLIIYQIYLMEVKNE